MDKCYHLYDGSHEEGWTCVNCGDEQETVSYYETVDANEKLEAIKKAEKELFRAGKEVFSTGFYMAFDLIDALMKEHRPVDIDDAIRRIKELREHAAKQI